MKTFKEMRMETVITSLRRFFEDPNVDVLKLDVDMDSDVKKKGIFDFMSLVDKVQRKRSITLILVRNEKSTTEKKTKRKLKTVNNYDKHGNFDPDPASIETPTTSHP